MDAMMLSQLVTVESAPASLPSEPKRAVQRSYPGAAQQPPLELDVLSRAGIARGSRVNTAPSSASYLASTPAPSSPGEDLLPTVDLEQSGQLDSPAAGESVEALQTFWEPYKNRFRFASVCLINLGNGMNDAAPGALLPYMER